MGKKIAIDFGTSNTVVSVWNENLEKAEIIKFSSISRRYRNPEGHDYFETYSIPSIINFDKNKILVGQDVFNRGKEFSEGTFRDIKRYIINRKPLPKSVGQNKKINYYEAGEFFIRETIRELKQILNDDISEVVFTVPVDSFQDYQEWINEICSKIKVDYYRVIDEPTACALGYNSAIEKESIFMVFDFGGGTLDVSIVKLERDYKNKKSAVIGKAGSSIGGIDIDTWLMEDLLKKNDLIMNDVQEIINHLLYNVEQAKIDLSFNDETSLSVFDDQRGILISGDYNRDGFNRILKENNFFKIILETLDDAIEEAAFKGISRREIDKILVIGGTSLIPSVKELLNEKFPGKVRSYSPFDAVAKGASFYSSGRILDDYIKHDYCLKHWIWSKDRLTGNYGYQPFIPRGTKYPVEEVAKFKIDAAIPGQKEVELMIFEKRSQNSQSLKNEMVYNINTGKYEIKTVNASGEEDKIMVNEKNPTFIKLEPPAKGGEKRISVSFGIDENRLLRITVLDLKTGRILYERQPVVKLE